MMESELPPGSFNSIGHLSTIGYHTLPGRMHHSTSTPAGVDGAGGGSRTPPATPKKGGKMLAIRVQMLDDSISMFQVQSKAFGRVLFDQVCRQLHLLEADYFGLEYLDANGTKYWLDVEKPLCRQIGLSMLEPTLRFCVKFYTPDPARLEEEFTRYLFCLQVKRDLAYGTIQCNENTSALMASYIIQAECGDFVPEDYPDHTYLSGYKFFPGQDSESERRIMENHKKHIGQSPAEADLNLLETARRCELYGIKMHPAKDYSSVPLSLAVCHTGILVFQNLTKISTFSWARIRKISFKRKKFLIKLHPEGNQAYHRDLVEFFFESRNECKNFWKKCVENHGFFRCSAVPRAPRQRARVISRGSSFRYSGKTQKQIVEFVRDNYVKRQTFQRSGSFRASRSLRTSRASVAQPTVSASISAHPLLPLPPGSDAISLEWEQQPHYLEASLMMRGYSPEAARERAARGRPARLPLPATTCAAMRQRVTAPELVTHAEVNHHPTEDSPLQHRMMIPSDMEERAWSPPAGLPARTHTDAEQTSPEDATVSTASLCMSPRTEDPRPLPLCASTPLVKSAGTYKHNGVDQVDNKKCDANSNYEEPAKTNVNIVLESRNSAVDVLSGAESDTCDTLSRTKQNNNNSIHSALEEITKSARNHRRDAEDIFYCVAKELLMTERTYKRDLELITVSWSCQVSELAGEGEPADIVEAFGRPCLALEPLVLRQGAFLATLERCLAEVSRTDTEEMEPEYKKIGDILLDYLSSSFEEYTWYMSRAGGLLALVESARRSCPKASPPAHVIHRPLQRHHHYMLLTDVLHASGASVSELRKTCSELCAAATAELRHVENHATLCQLQRDLTGYDKLLVPDRQFVQFGCLYKHSSKGLQQRMIFLFSDIMVVASKPGVSAQFRAVSAWGLRGVRLERANLPNSFTLHNDEMSMLLSASNEQEFLAWMNVLRETIDNAPRTDDVDLTVDHSDTASASPACAAGVALAHVCWHRACSLHATHLHTVLCTELSGYLLRKFKSSHGWQKLWVVLSTCTLHFYKSWLDPEPLASLPMLGYSVGVPSEQDSISKDFVFKLQHKSHVYFFRADCQYTYNRWTDTLRQATTNCDVLRY